MKRTILVGLLSGAIALAGAPFVAGLVAAPQQAEQPAEPATPGLQEPPEPQEPPAPQEPPEPTEPAEPTEPPEPTEPAQPTDPAAPSEPAMPGAPGAEPETQPDTEAADVSGLPSGELDLGNVRIPRAVQANGEPLPAGTYQVRLTADTADATASKGATAEYERWVEFLKGDQPVGREMASIVPESEIDNVAKSGKPGANGSRVEMLKGGDFYRVWIRKGDANFLIHLVAEASGT
ncbi:MAG: hypothetical protein GEU99_04470 [Luteitalea sp.]|nr:hypothetical protein [Luteitalea sp.]